MKKLITIAGIALATTGITACGTQAQEKATPKATPTTQQEQPVNTPTPAPTVPRNSYPASIEESFLKSCSGTSGGMATQCQCALNKLEERYTIDEVLRLVEASGDKLPPEFESIVYEGVSE